jgi:exosome complex RNA-binding protein Rrp42 (RNase PH superfamily)
VWRLWCAVVKVALSPLSSPSVVEAGTGGDSASGTARGSSGDAEALSYRLARLFESCGILDRSALCIQEGKYAWCLSASVTLLDNSGGSFDALCCALSLALASTRLPQVEVTPAGVRRVHAADEPQTRTPLPLTHFLCPSSFAFIPAHAAPLADPAIDEEDLLDASLFVTVTVPIDSTASAATVAHTLARGAVARDAASLCTALAVDHADALARSFREALSLLSS